MPIFYQNNDFTLHLLPKQGKIAMNVGQEIRRIRESKRLNQTVIAEKIGLDTSSYARIEKKGNKLTVEQLESIANALGVSVLELITGEQRKATDNEEMEKLRHRVDELEEFVRLLRSANESANIESKFYKSEDFYSIIETVINYLKTNKIPIQSENIESELNLNEYLLLIPPTIIAQAIKSTGNQLIERLKFLLSFESTSKNIMSEDVHKHLWEVINILNENQGEIDYYYIYSKSKANYVRKRLIRERIESLIENLRTQ